MPRSQQSPLGRVLEYFRTVDLKVLPEVYGLVQDVVRERRGRSEQAKAKAKAAAPTATAAAATPAQTPKAKTAKPAGPKKSHHKKKPPVAAAGARRGSGQPTLTAPLPDAGADPGVLQPATTGEEFPAPETAEV